MAAVPEWAPPHENHVLRSTSVVSQVAYAPDSVSWTTFDTDATETLRLVSRPEAVTAGGKALVERDTLDEQGYVVQPLASGDAVVRVRHTTPGTVVVTTGSPAPPSDKTATHDLATAGACAVGAGSSRTGGEGAPTLAAGLAVLLGLRHRKGRYRRG
jgi:hypothetical protein